MLSLRGTVAAIGCAMLVLATAPSAAASVVGVDLSHWDGVVNWPALVAGHRSFVFAEATHGRTAVDPSYLVNRTGAQAVGVPFGAYHFALPRGADAAALTADAIAQADAFVDYAQPASGDLLPVLDLERSGGLAPANLIAWTSAWLGEVQARLAVKPIIYTGFNFWRDALANTAQFASAGYRLWYARYTGARNTLAPAANWAGKGWTFWQWTSCARIRGLARCGDADRFHGRTLAAVTIPNAAPLPPTATTPPSVVGLAQSGRLLAAVPGAWFGAEPISFTYQWDRCDASGSGCTAIPAASKEAYRPQQQDVGDKLSVQVTAVNVVGTAAASVSTPPIAPPSG